MWWLCYFKVIQSTLRSVDDGQPKNIQIDELNKIQTRMFSIYSSANRTKSALFTVEKTSNTEMFKGLKSTTNMFSYKTKTIKN